MSEKVTIGDATLYCGDCREILPTLDPVDAVITDPPYGQAQNVNVIYEGGSREHKVRQHNGSYLSTTARTYTPIDGDDEPFDPIPLLALSPAAFIWGAHKFGHLLPKGRLCVWDKVPTGKTRSQGDGEIAWTNVKPDAPLRIFRLLWDGLCVGKGARHEVTAGQKRYHPMQKPVILMDWCWQQAGEPASVLDPYMGSGSTGVMCAARGVQFIGVESVPEYFDIACKRIEQAYAQGRLAL